MKHLQGHYAGFISRLLAFVIDAAAISLIIGATTWFISVTATVLQLRTFLGFSLSSVPGSDKFIDALFGPYVAGAFVTLVLISYHVIFLTFVGQTPGKALMGLRVVTVHGQRLSYARSFLRLLAYVVSGIPFYLGFVWVLVDDRRQAWHDKVAGTYVIYTWEARHDEQFLLDEIRQVQNGATPLQIAASLIDDDEPSEDSPDAPTRPQS